MGNHLKINLAFEKISRLLQSNDKQSKERVRQILVKRIIVRRRRARLNQLIIQNTKSIITSKRKTQLQNGLLL